MKKMTMNERDEQQTCEIPLLKRILNLQTQDIIRLFRA